MHFVHLVSKYHQGDTIKLEVLRDKEVLSLDAEVGPWDPLVPVRFHDKPPYFIHAGFVFATLSQQLIVVRTSLLALSSLSLSLCLLCRARL